MKIDEMTVQDTKIVVKQTVFALTMFKEIVGKDMPAELALEGLMERFGFSRILALRFLGAMLEKAILRLENDCLLVNPSNLWCRQDNNSTEQTIVE